MLPAPSCSSGSSASSSHSHSANHLAPTNDPYIIDMIKLADDRITQLQAELDSFKQANEIMDTKISNYKTQVFIFNWIFVCTTKKIKYENTLQRFDSIKLFF
jgi:hypothetical protein